MPRRGKEWKRKEVKRGGGEEERKALDTRRKEKLERGNKEEDRERDKIERKEKEKVRVQGLKEERGIS